MVESVSEVWIEILHPPCGARGLDANNASLVLRLSHGTVDFLLPGDIEAAGERSLLASGQPLQSEILKIPHHGSRSSSTNAFVRAVSPQLAVASLGSFNRFDFPAPEIVQRYLGHEVELLRTDRDGTVRCEQRRSRPYAYAAVCRQRLIGWHRFRSQRRTLGGRPCSGKIRHTPGGT